jgi:hydroxyethylthiazole kinase-like uncharacterized protein yjeF
MKIVSASEMREIDRVSSERFGVPSLTLMENAGSAVAEFVLSHYPGMQRIGVICGKGNNGGDGFVAARKLHDAGKAVRVLLLAEPSEVRGDAAEMLSRLPASPAVARSLQELRQPEARLVFESELLIDAILGTGFKPPVSGAYADAIAQMNAEAAAVVAVDIPSGGDADAMQEQRGLRARASAVVTFTAPRPSHIFAALTEGPIVVAAIGSPEEAIVSSLKLNVITARDAAALTGPRPPNSNKGSFGHVLVMGGAVGKAGSAAMAGMAVLRSGAGLSTIATPKSVLPTVAGFHPEVMTEPLEETEAGTISKRVLGYGHADALLKNISVLAVGPGISRHPETADFVRALVKRYDLPLVLDADGLNAFEGKASELNGKNRRLVITPHPGEMARLLGSTVAAVQQDRQKTARDFSREHEVIVVLKGHRTVIAFPDGAAWVNTTGNAGMATGGTGDILTGMVAGLMAQHSKQVPQAVMAAVYLHGLAGDVARETMGEQCMTATDLLKALPEAFRRVQRASKEKLIRL